MQSVCSLTDLLVLATFILHCILLCDLCNFHSTTVISRMKLIMTCVHGLFSCTIELVIRISDERDSM